MIRDASCHDAVFGKDIRGVLAAAERFQFVPSVRGEDRCIRRPAVKLLQSRDSQVGFVRMMNGGDVELELIRKLCQIVVVDGLVRMRVAVE